MQALLLDLRQNPGGILGESVRVAQYLVPKGPIVSVIDREGRKYTEESYLEQVKYPLAVLVDHGSASASEIVAGAVQDTKSGKLFGTRTFGKGSVQTVYRLPQNTGLKLTTAKYYTPSGRSINGTGITPDEVVELPEQPQRIYSWKRQRTIYVICRNNNLRTNALKHWFFCFCYIFMIKYLSI